jgi:hypothetical protein
VKLSISKSLCLSQSTVGPLKKCKGPVVGRGVSSTPTPSSATVTDCASPRRPQARLAPSCAARTRTRWLDSLSWRRVSRCTSQRGLRSGRHGQAPAADNTSSLGSGGAVAAGARVTNYDNVTANRTRQPPTVSRPNALG